MKIAIVVPHEEPVPPKTYGGTELVAYNLIEQLVAMGHDVTLIGSGDSQTSARLIAPEERSMRQLGSTFARYREHYHYIYVGKVVSILAGQRFDIVHNHLGWRLLPFSNVIKSPMVTTLHGPLNVEDQQLFYQPFPNANYISISKNQRRGMPQLNFVANVYNGIEVQKFKVGTGKRQYLAFLGRFSPEKGPEQAIKVAKKAGLPLIMAGKVDPVDEAYFNKRIRPSVDGKQIKFIGEVNHPQKVKLLSGAKALLSPVQWEEPFGLVNAEALACGTPVVALARGSLPELIADGKVGFICNDLKSMVASLKKIGTIKAMDCRSHAEDNFSAGRMAKGYLGAYQKVIGGVASGVGL